jgi:hypothetical protein
MHIFRGSLSYISEFKTILKIILSGSFTLGTAGHWLRPKTPGYDQFHLAAYGWVSYLVFVPKPRTHRMHDLGSIAPHIWPKVFIDNQMSQIKYNYYYINSVSKDYDDS